MTCVAERAALVRSDQGCRELVDLGGQDEVVLVQAFDLLGLKGDGRIAPTEADIRVMALRLRQCPDLTTRASASRKLPKRYIRSIRRASSFTAQPGSWLA